MNRLVRLKEINIHNFKNVGNGNVLLPDHIADYKSSFLGIYGQNGSGKTTLIDAIELLKIIMCGRKTPRKYADYVEKNKDHSELSFRFSVCVNDKEYNVLYKFSLFAEKANLDHENTDPLLVETHFVPVIKNETLSFSMRSSYGNYTFQKLMSTEETDTLLPANKRKELVGNQKKIMTDLLVIRQITSSDSRSFLFSAELLNLIRKHCKNDNYIDLIESLVWFANYDLFIINKADSSIVSLNALPLNFSFTDKDRHSYFGTLPVNINKATAIPVEQYHIVEQVINGMNVVLEQLVPGLTIIVKNLGNQLDEKGNTLVTLELLSHRDNVEIPLKYESDGIKKIISVLELLIAVYNRQSITVAIDELDAGIFEYLLGEMLRIISENGKGQLIFTSHNLRPLETLNKNFIMFTTTDPENRYIHLTNVKSTNNLRDFYYRDIQLGLQSEEVYEQTDNFDIALAFKKAGEAFDA